MRTPVVWVSADLDPTDDDALGCALADEGGCAGPVEVAWSVDGTPCFLCEWHAAGIRWLVSGLVSTIRDTVAPHPLTKAG